MLVPVDETSTVGDVLTTACSRRQLNVVEHFLRLKSNVDVKGNVRDAVNVPDGRSRLRTQVTLQYSVVNQSISLMDKIHRTRRTIRPLTLAH